jgi:hypothetical protein
VRHECWCSECPNYAAAGVTLRESETFVRDGVRRCATCKAPVIPHVASVRSATIDLLLAVTAGGLVGACAAGVWGAMIGATAFVFFWMLAD